VEGSATGGGGKVGALCFVVLLVDLFSSLVVDRTILCGWIWCSLLICLMLSALFLLVTIVWKILILLAFMCAISVYFL
jgi:hypothetical protein